MADAQPILLLLSFLPLPWIFTHCFAKGLFLVPHTTTPSPHLPASCCTQMWVFFQAFGILNNLPEINTSISQHLAHFLMLVLAYWFQVVLFKHSLPWVQHLLTLASTTVLSLGTLKSIILHSHTLTQFRTVSSIQTNQKISITGLLALIAVCSDLRHPLCCSLGACVSRPFTDQQESS